MCVPNDTVLDFVQHIYLGMHYGDIIVTDIGALKRIIFKFQSTPIQQLKVASNLQKWLIIFFSLNGFLGNQ